MADDGHQCGAWSDVAASGSSITAWLLTSTAAALEHSSSNGGGGGLSVDGVVVSILLLAGWLLYGKLFVDWRLGYWLRWGWEFLTVAVPTVDVPLTAVEAAEDLADNPVNAGADAATKTPLVDPQQPHVIQCYDPSTKQFLGTVPAMTPAQVDEACAKAAAAQPAWAQTTFAQRRLVLRTIQKYCVEHIDDLCRVSTRDSGKPPVDALLGEVLTTCEKIRCINSWGELWLEPEQRPTGPLMMHKVARVEYVPLGVLAPIAPWNYPLHNLLNHIISGLFAGNAVVGKVSEHTSWSAAYFGRIVRAALTKHGHSPDLVQTITGFGDAGAALVSNPHVAKVIFTGSPGIGKKVMETAARHLKPVVLELGGKDAMVLTGDCKIPEVVPWILRGCFQNSGQNCVGVERLVVYESIHDNLVQALVPRVQALRQGIPLPTCGSDGAVDCGAMVTHDQCLLVQRLVDDAVAQGAKLLVGGNYNTSDPQQPQFYPPTILTHVTPAMKIFQEEVFGPVMTIIKVPKDSDEACLELVNASRFGLGSSVYCGTNQAHGLALGRKIRSGMMCVNDFGSNYLIQSLPFGGVNDSGFGRFAGVEGLRACCLERAIVTDLVPALARTSIPPPLDYPIDKTRGMGFASGLIHLFYDESWWGKIKGIGALIKHG